MLVKTEQESFCTYKNHKRFIVILGIPESDFISNITSIAHKVKHFLQLLMSRTYHKQHRMQCFWIRNLKRTSAARYKKKTRERCWSTAARRKKNFSVQSSRHFRKHAWNMRLHNQCMQHMLSSTRQKLEKTQSEDVTQRTDLVLHDLYYQNANKALQLTQPVKGYVDQWSTP